MKLRHVLFGLIGLVVLAVWGLVSMIITFLFTGKFFNDDNN